MKITLLTVGKTTFGFAAQGEELYQKRLQFYTQFRRVDIPQLKNAASLSREDIKVKEGELILKALKPDDDVILLEERDKSLGKTTHHTLECRHFCCVSHGCPVFFRSWKYETMEQSYCYHYARCKIEGKTPRISYVACNYFKISGNHNQNSLSEHHCKTEEGAAYA